MLGRLLGWVLWHWQLSLAAQRTVNLSVSRLGTDLLVVAHLWPQRYILINEAWGRIWWTVKEGLSVDSSSLLELLFHLIRHHLLAQSNFSKMSRTVIVLMLAF